MQDFILKFGKFRGQSFLSTPKSYQAWLTSQAWFQGPGQEATLEKAPSYSLIKNG
jgi:uncharacterized protein (DUF3820 family)